MPGTIPVRSSRSEGRCAVNHAFQRVLDNPDVAEVLQHPALKPLLLDEGGRRLGLRQAQRAGRANTMSHHLSGP